MGEVLAGTVLSEVAFGYLIIIKLNNTTLFVFSKNTQYKHCLTLNHRLEAMIFFFFNEPTSGQKLELLGILLKPHPLLPHIPVGSASHGWEGHLATSTSDLSVWASASPVLTTGVFHLSVGSR